MSIALVFAGCRGCDARGGLRDAGRSELPVAPALPPPAAELPPFVESGLPEEPSALALVLDASGDAVVVADVGPVRRALGAASFRSARADGSRLRFAVTLGATPIAVADDADGWEVATLEPSPRRARVPADGSFGTLRRATSGDALYLVHASENPPVVLDEFRLTADGIRHVRRVLDDADDGLSREVVGLAADDDGFAALFRRGTPEDSRGGVALATERGTFDVDPLHELAMLESIERGGGAVAVVGSFEFDRPIAYQLDLRGRLLRFERLGPGERPTFTSTRARATLELDEGTVVVRVLDASGDLLDERRFARLEGRCDPVILRERHGFAIAWTDRNGEGWGVRLAHVGVEVR